MMLAIMLIRHYSTYVQKWTTNRYISIKIIFNKLIGNVIYTVMIRQLKFIIVQTHFGDPMFCEYSFSEKLK